MSLDIKLSKSQLSKINHSGGFLSALLGNFPTPLMILVVPLAKNVLVPVAIKICTSVIDGAIQRKMCGRGAIATSGAGKLL